MSYVDAVINGTGWGSEGGSGTANAVLYTPQTLTPAQQLRARENIGGEAAAKTVVVSGTNPVITPEDNTIYQCGELTTLTITDPPASGIWSVVFSSGSGATTTIIPTSILGVEKFAAVRDSVCEINVMDNRALCQLWSPVMEASPT